VRHSSGPSEVSVHELRRREGDRRLIFLAGLIELAVGAAAAAPPNLDLHVVDRCQKGSTDEIVVCGSRDRQSRYRLPKLPHTYDRKPLRAEADVGRTHARAQVQSETRPDGLADKRIMITFTAPF
jgi:hypothetical protein